MVKKRELLGEVIVPSVVAIYAGKSSVLMITLARWDWFEQWQDGRLRHRGEEYESIKNSIGEQMWKVCCHLFPQLDGKVGKKW